MSRRSLVLLALLVTVAGTVYFAPGPWHAPDGFLEAGKAEPAPAEPPLDKSDTLPIDEEAKAEIRRYMAGIELSGAENNLQYAIKLDHGRGRPAFSSGNYREAYEIYRKVLAISYHHGSMMGIGIGLGQLGAIFDRMGNEGEAMSANLLAYKVGKAMGNPAEYGVTELRLARLFAKDQRFVGLLWRIRAKKSLEGTPYKEDYVRLLSALGADKEAVLERPEEARILYAQAWEMARGLGESADQKWAKWDSALRLARSLRGSGECSDALAVLQEVLGSFGEAERDTDNYAALLHERARCNRDLGRTAVAERAFAEAYAHYELARIKSLGDVGRAKTDASFGSLVDDFIDFHIGEGALHEALALLETSKARTLDDILADSDQQSVYARWVELEARQAAERVAYWAARETQDGLPDPSLEQGETFTELLARQRKTLRSARIELGLRAPGVGRMLSGTDVKAIQKRIPANAAVLAAYTGSRQVGMFLMTPNRLEFFPSALDPLTVRRRVTELRIALSNPYVDLYVEGARELFVKLMRPVTAALGDRPVTLFYTPDQLLVHLPLGALQDGDRFLAERYPIFRLPSLRYFAETMSEPAPGAKAGIACVDPIVPGRRLPFQRQTGERLSALFGSSVVNLTGRECAPDTLNRTIGSLLGEGFLHVGAHGRFFDSDPMGSGVMLSSGNDDGHTGFWGARQMGTTDLSRLALITLSSCETGLTDSDKARDVFGILRALHYAGARDVIAPLWAVHGHATAHLMQSFYERYAQGDGPANALWAARRAMVDGKEFAHPYYWAGFVLTGVRS